MSCSQFDDFELGLVEAGEMKRHLETCADCRRQAALDERLTLETGSLRAPVDDAGLWNRIEAKLAAEVPGYEHRPTSLTRFLEKFIPRPGSHNLFQRAGVAALACAAVGLAAWFLFLRPSPGSASGLMADAALIRVEAEEREYAAAIEELEASAGPKLAGMDFSLMALYRDRLETIDAQIERCREAIGQNPWNAHIRRYMLAALRDKKDTLGLILSQQ